MNYQRIYNQIIERAQNRQLGGYKEKHHIIPKCLGGNDDLSNLIELTAREHFLCHVLLVEIYPNEGKLKQALWLMAIGKRRCKYNEYRVSSRTYERLKEDFCDRMRLPKSEETKAKMRKPKSNTDKMGGPMSEETKQKLRKSRPEGFGLKHSERLKGIPKIKRTEEHSDRLATDVYQYDLNNNFIEKFNSMKKAGEKTGANPSTIGMVCRGVQKTAGGYIWKYN